MCCEVVFRSDVYDIQLFFDLVENGLRLRLVTSCVEELLSKNDCAVMTLFGGCVSSLRMRTKNWS